MDKDNRIEILALQNLPLCQLTTNWVNLIYAYLCIGFSHLCRLADYLKSLTSYFNRGWNLELQNQVAYQGFPQGRCGGAVQKPKMGGGHSYFLTKYRWKFQFFIIWNEGFFDKKWSKWLKYVLISNTKVSKVCKMKGKLWIFFSFRTAKHKFWLHFTIYQFFTNMSNSKPPRKLKNFVMVKNFTAFNFDGRVIFCTWTLAFMRPCTWPKKCHNFLTFLLTAIKWLALKKSDLI